MSRQYDDLIDFCNKNNVCEYCFSSDKDCSCYEDVMNSIYFDEQQEIEEYLNR